jgi:ABC-type uncharacterized transport system auxiliary subunit
MPNRPYAIRSFFAACALLCSLAGCTDDFSRFKFGQKKPANTAAQKASAATGTGGDIAPADDRDE